MKTKKIITLIFIIIWMITVFLLSHQPSDKSEALSKELTSRALKIQNIQPKNPFQLDKIETVIRKSAHYSIYLIGGILIFVHVNLYDITIKRKVLLSQLIRYNIFNN